jgi:dGTPase
MPLYSANDWRRQIPVRKSGEKESYRAPCRRDFARLIHSPSFRRLQGKTQVFPGRESDFFRNRLTHSLEVAQIAKSIAIRLNNRSKWFRQETDNINPELAELAGLAHDLGHPPFGHNGEHALDECMQNCGGFEGNAQTFRILSRLEKKETKDVETGAYLPISSAGEDLRVGLNFTFRSLASVLKYDQLIPFTSTSRTKKGVQKGYYAEDKNLVRRIKRNVIGDESVAGFKTVECSIMDIADDIAYSTYDLEDNFKGDFLSPLKLLALPNAVLDAVAQDITERARKYYSDVVGDDYVCDPFQILDVLQELFSSMLVVDKDEQEILHTRALSDSDKKMLLSFSLQQYSEKLASNGYYRTSFTSSLVQRFVQGVEVKPHQRYPQLHRVRLRFPTFLEVEVLKNITYHGVIRAPRVQVVEYRGKDIIRKIFDAIAGPGGLRLMPDDFQALCEGGTEAHHLRVIADFIAGMTDRYAIEFYVRLFGAEGLTIHKPF